ncbi:uncharacterized protein BXZ73DRAFT_76668 [Epithele typhae]|uniref:uncharacterized protein n=1 Tax=Epithele typhae TaxID=378194 RepID=UPI002007B7B6|nr:uncharacterized protein BXZ73DRAFT_76668 [Epithele typhae]KAH9936878.1 hypothetical protein BXZ73DRAFT_76668 [Epithele typhae]
MSECIVWDSQTGTSHPSQWYRLADSSSHPNLPSSFAFCPTEKQWALASRHDITVFPLPVETPWTSPTEHPQPVGRIDLQPLHGMVTRLVWSRDGSQIFVQDSKANFHIYDALTFTHLLTLSLPPIHMPPFDVGRPESTLALSEDERYLLSDVALAPDPPSSATPLGKVWMHPSLPPARLQSTPLPLPQARSRAATEFAIKIYVIPCDNAEAEAEEGDVEGDTSRRVTRVDAGDARGSGRGGGGGRRGRTQATWRAVWRRRGGQVARRRRQARAEQGGVGELRGRAAQGEEEEGDVRRRRRVTSDAGGGQRAGGRGQRAGGRGQRAGGGGLCGGGTRVQEGEAEKAARRRRKLLVPRTYSGVYATALRQHSSPEREDHPPHVVAICRDGTLLTAAVGFPDVVTTIRPAGLPAGKLPPIRGASFSSGGARVLVVGSVFCLVLDTLTGATIAGIDSGRYDTLFRGVPESAELSGDGRVAMIQNVRLQRWIALPEPEWWLWKVEDGTLHQVLSCEDGPAVWECALSQDGRVAGFATEKGEVFFRNVGDLCPTHFL